MQIILQKALQKSGSGSSTSWAEPNFKLNGMLVKVSAISINSLGTAVIKLQHSDDNSTWIDIPGAATNGLNSIGNTFVIANPTVTCFDYLRIAWTFNNVNSCTFACSITGDK